MYSLFFKILLSRHNCNNFIQFTKLFMKKKNHLWFTLIELMMAIAVIWIIAIWWMRMDFNKISDSQYLRIFTGKITSLYETTRNNMLIGRSINAAGTTPSTWKIEIPIWSGKTLTTSYSTWWLYTNYAEWGYAFKPAEWISKIYCYTSTGTTLTSITAWTWVILINKDTISFSGTTTCDTTTTKRIVLETLYHSNTGTIEINGLSGIITSTY